MTLDEESRQGVLLLALNGILLRSKYDYLTIMLIVQRPSGHYKTQLNEILHCVKQYSRNLFNAEKETT